MCNIRDVHLKIKELSSNKPGGRPHIYAKNLAKELGITEDEIKPFLDLLYSIAFVDHYKDCTDIIALTEKGKREEIPLSSWQREDEGTGAPK